MFHECRYNFWGKNVYKQRSEAKLPSVPHPGTHLADFTAWIIHYNDTKAKFLGCYHPWNFQSRFLTSKAQIPHYGDQDPLEPNLTKALDTLHKLDFVGINDFFHETKCLFISRLPDFWNNSIACNYFFNACRCDVGLNDRENGDSKLTHEGLHGAKVTRLDHLDLPQNLTKLMDHMSEVDQEVFRHALQTFFVEIKSLEQNVGHRILCESSLLEKKKSLEYLNIDVVSLYDRSMPRHQLSSDRIRKNLSNQTCNAYTPPLGCGYLWY